ncbi:formin-like protein 5 [Phacochoerus africanus]|uniref:formin-like protein 5 n=1 Tax=Phacochoerus africanus TaxID=41426 RepID=UPI001FDA5492|nr:formin-like protein 5 [Phacochoerus africanus]
MTSLSPSPPSPPFPPPILNGGEGGKQGKSIETWYGGILEGIPRCLTGCSHPTPIRVSSQWQLPPTPHPPSRHTFRNTGPFPVSRFSQASPLTDPPCGLKSPDLLRRQRLWHQRTLWEGTAPGPQNPTGPFPEPGPGAAPAPTHPFCTYLKPPAPLRHFCRSSLPHSPLPPQEPLGIWCGSPGSPPGSGSSVRLPRTPGNLSGQNPRLRPAPRRSSPPLRQGSPGAAHLSQGPAPTRSPPPRQAAGVRGAQGPGGRPPPLVAAAHSDSHRSPCAQNAKEASRPPRRCAKPARGCAGCGTNRSRRGCREGGRRDTARMGSAPPPRPTVVPTQRGRGREEPQAEGRGLASPPSQRSPPPP